MEIRSDKDPLGTRIKENYENRTRYYLPRRTYTLIRLDGCHFKTYTRGLKKPFDYDLSEDIDKAIIAMLPEIQGAAFAYTQSDEVSILLTDFTTPQTSAWFDGNLQKICSVVASMMTAEFNILRARRTMRGLSNVADVYNDTIMPSLAYFDARVFTIPDRVEVMNYFIWRNQDCSRNSVSMVAQSNFSHKELQGKSTSEMHEMLHQKGINWATDFSDEAKNGRLFVKEVCETVMTIPNAINSEMVPQVVRRNQWVSIPAWKFTENKDALLKMIPEH